jgi:2-oxoglutarate ferredoxin oxidoreductase subunit beta
MKKYPMMPDSYKESSKPSNFCPGCGHSLILKNLGFTIDRLKLAKKTVFTTDIGCSLLAWDFFDIDTIQSHHGRAVSTAVGVKKALPKSNVIAYMGDGGGYAIGLHHLIHAAKRNEPLAVILVNNTVFAMTGGQKAPTTLNHEITETTPEGHFTEKEPIFGPELLAQVAAPDAYLARAAVSNLPQLKLSLEKVFEVSAAGNFAFLEILSYCPVNWKKDAKGCFDFMEELKKIYPLGEVKR